MTRRRRRKVRAYHREILAGWLGGHGNVAPAMLGPMPLHVRPPPRPPRPVFAWVLPAEFEEVYLEPMPDLTWRLPMGYPFHAIRILDGTERAGAIVQNPRTEPTEEQALVARLLREARERDHHDF